MAGTRTARVRRSAMRAACPQPAPHLLTAPPRMAKTSTTRSKAALFMPGPLSCRRCWPRANGLVRAGPQSCCGIAVGTEVMCRLSLVAPKLVHQAGFHPTAVFGTLAAAIGRCDDARARRRQMVDALGIAGSMAGGIIEYLADGAWTNACTLAGRRNRVCAALLARAGFDGPRTVFEGDPRVVPRLRAHDQGRLLRIGRRLRPRWLTETLAFKLYPCGTMTHPYIDCARRSGDARVRGRRHRRTCLRGWRGYRASLVGAICRKTAPAPNGYGAKFSTPYCIAAGFHSGQCRARRVYRCGGRDPAVRRSLARCATCRSGEPLSTKFHRPHPGALA